MSSPQQMDQREKRAACKIIKREFSKSGRYSAWRASAGFGLRDNSFGSLPNIWVRRRNAGVKNKVTKVFKFTQT